MNDRLTTDALRVVEDAAHVREILDRVLKLALARDRKVDHVQRTMTITDDDAVYLLIALGLVPEK